MGVGSVRAVVFDVGGTLWFDAVAPSPGEIERHQAVRVQPLVDAWGLNLQEPLVAVLSDIWAAYEEAWRAEDERGTLRDPSLPFIIRGALGVRGIEISDAQAEEWWRAAWISETQFGLQLYPDVLDVLRELREMGIALGISTNRPCTADMHLPGLRDFGIAPYVDAVVCSGDTGYVKPHPSTFELVLERLGVGADEAVMVGDSAANDIRGAKAVGMRTVWKLNGRYGLPPCPDADFAIHDLAELLSLPILPRLATRAVRAESPMPHDDDNEDRY